MTAEKISEGALWVVALFCVLGLLRSLWGTWLCGRRTNK